ncbi:MAG: YihY/virulence factor BrkB family protein [Chitinivibrionales bacterium]
MRLIGYLHRILKRFFHSGGPLIAKGIAYSIIVGSVPLLFLALYSSTYFFAVAPPLQMTLEIRLDEIFPEELADAILTQAARLAAFSWAEIGIVGIAGLLLVSQGIFSSLERGLSIVMYNRRRRSMWANRLIYTILTIFAITLFFAATYAHTYLKIYYGALGIPPGYHFLARKTSSIILIWLALVVIYRICYSNKINYLALVLVSLAVAIMWQLINIAGSSLITASGQREIIYGMLAMVVVFLLWSYIFGLLLLLGGIIIATHSPQEKMPSSQQGRVAGVESREQRYRRMRNKFEV